MTTNNQSFKLSSHPIKRSRDADEVEHFVASALGSKAVIAKDSIRNMDLHANCYNSDNLALWFCSYGAPLTLVAPESDFIRVQFQLQGCGMTKTGGQEVEINSRQACITHDKKSELNFGSDYQQLVLRIKTDKVISKLHALTGQPVVKALEFHSVFNLQSPEGFSMRQMLDLFVRNVESGFSPRLLAELEHMLIFSLLYAGNHNCSSALREPVPDIARWQVRRAEEFIEAHWASPLNIEEIAAATNTSVRSLFRAFQRDKGYSPMAFMKKVRLRKARELLQGADPHVSVTKIAYLCGFSDSSRFSKDYKQSFGELPSDTRRQYRAGD